MKINGSAFLGAVCVLTFATASHAADPEQACQKACYDAAARYAACQQKVLGNLFGGGSVDAKFEATLSKCRVKYADTWATRQAKASDSGTTCDTARFEDHADGTGTDRLTRTTTHPSRSCS